MLSLLVIGDVYTETQYFVDTIPASNEFTISTDATSTYGSKTINASRIFSRLQNEVTFFAHVGDDADGVNSIPVLKKWDITSQIKAVTGERTGKIVVITDKHGKSAITLFRGANQSVDENAISELENILPTYDGVYAATNLPLESLYILTDMCNKMKVPLFIDVPNQHTLLKLAKLASIDFFAPNRQETELLLKQKISSVDDALAATVKLRKFLKGTIIITLDKEGCVVFKKDEKNPIHFVTTPIQSADETAAGDVFRAVFFDHFLKSKSIEEAIQRALKISTESTKITGVDKTLSNLIL